MTRHLRFEMFLLFIGLVLLVPRAVSGQSVSRTPKPPVSTGAIAGEVKDHQGMPLAGVTVTITNDETKESASSKTDAIGGFAIERLEEGNYQVTISAKGYVSKVEKARVKARHTTRLHIRLKSPVASSPAPNTSH
jgi:hypothetical protein